jgi:hypothetical protein
LQKKLISVLLTVALIGGLLIASALPAQANHNDGPPPASLLPDDDGVGALTGTVLGDRDDGTDQTAHLTALAPTAVERVQWRKCPTTVTAPVDNADIAACNVILGADTTGVAIGGAGFGVSPDEAYELKLDITAQMETDSPADVLTLGCDATAGEDVEPPGNCFVVLDEGITFDDGASGLPGTQASTGEMFQICTTDTAATGGPAATGTEAAEPCQYDTNRDTDITDATDADTTAERNAVDARFVAWGHGNPVPNDGFVIRASTSPDLNAVGALEGYRDWTGISGTTGESDSSDSGDESCTILNANATRVIWECAFDDPGAGDDNAVQEIGIFEQATTGQGACATPLCILDKHGAQSQARAATTAVLTFVNAATVAGARCDTPDDAERNALGATERVELCLDDQFGQPFSGAATLELDTATVTTTGFTASTECTPRDHDGDGYAEHCDGATGADGPLRAEFVNPQDLLPPADKGTQIITGCFEGEPFVATPAPTDHGCTDETVKDTVSKEWFSLPSEVDLVYAGTGDPADPCDTGDAFRENRIGQTDMLLVCTFDNFENPTTTDQVDGGRMQWTITPSGGGDRTGVEFVSPPPAETDAVTAQATAEIVATRRSNNNVCVILEPEDPEVPTGPNLDDCVQKAVSPGGGGRATSAVTIRGKFRGRVKSSLGACRRGRRVLVKKVRPGRDATVGTDRANRRGKWRVRKPNARGRFYAQVRKNAQCRGDRSKIVRRR